MIYVKELTIPGHEFLTASVPPTIRCSSMVNVLAGPTPQLDSGKTGSSPMKDTVVVVVNVVVVVVGVVVVVVVTLEFNSSTIPKELFAKLVACSTLLLLLLPLVLKKLPSNKNGNLNSPLFLSRSYPGSSAVIDAQQMLFQMLCYARFGNRLITYVQYVENKIRDSN